MTLQEILLGGGVGCACILLLVQLSPLKINPWSALWKGLKWLWKAFTRSLNADVDHYEAYCRDHPKYENNRAVCAIANIKRVYAERMAKHDFQ